MGSLQAAFVTPGTPSTVQGEMPAWRRLVRYIDLSWGSGRGIVRFVSVRRNGRGGCRRDRPFMTIPTWGRRTLRDVRRSARKGLRRPQSGSQRRRWNFRLLATEIFRQITRHRGRGAHGSGKGISHGWGYHSQRWEVEWVQVELGNGNRVLLAHGLDPGLLHLDLAFEPRAIESESVCCYDDISRCPKNR